MNLCVYFNFFFCLEAKFLVNVNVDGNFLTKPVEEIFHKHELLTMPFMTGVNSDEAGLIVPDVSFFYRFLFFQRACVHV